MGILYDEARLQSRQEELHQKKKKFTPQIHIVRLTIVLLECFRSILYTVLGVNFEGMAALLGPSSRHPPQIMMWCRALLQSTVRCPEVLNA
jgi:hypothetical protein